MVVYGHTPVPDPDWLNKTINIDTGCVFGSRLSCVVLEGDGVAELRADGSAPLTLFA